MLRSTIVFRVSISSLATGFFEPIDLYCELGNQLLKMHLLSTPKIHNKNRAGIVKCKNNLQHEEKVISYKYQNNIQREGMDRNVSREEECAC